MPEPAEIVMVPPEAWQAYRALRLRALAEEPQAFGETYASAAALPDARWQGRLADAVGGQNQWLLFARRGEQLVGMIAAFPHAPDRTPGAPGLEETREARIVSVFVAAEERGNGTGGRLMAAMLDALRRAGRFERASLTVNEAQVAAVALYRRFGFEVVDQLTAVLGDGQLHRELVMARPLRERLENGQEPARSS